MKNDCLITIVEDMKPTTCVALLKVLFALPPSLSAQRKYTNRERNAIRRAHLLRKKLTKQYANKNILKRPDKRPRQKTDRDTLQ